MAGMFELFIDVQSRYRFRLVAPDGTVMAVSKGFDDKPAAVCGIGDVREYAGTGLILDLCPVADQPGGGPSTPEGDSQLERPVVSRLPFPRSGLPSVKAHPAGIGSA